MSNVGNIANTATLLTRYHAVELDIDVDRASYRYGLILLTSLIQLQDPR